VDDGDGGGGRGGVQLTGVKNWKRTDPAWDRFYYIDEEEWQPV
jgi:hypothetical protein